MNIFAHNGHDHAEEIAQSLNNSSALLLVGVVAIAVIISVGIVLYLKRKK